MGVGSVSTGSQPELLRRPRGAARDGRLQRGQARRDRPDQGRRARLRAERDPGQRRRAGAILIEGGIGAAPADVRERVAHTLPLKRIGRLREVAQVAARLRSDAASFVNGITASIDGGELAGAA
jgi:NAD(P)-dependent dehydrogenase (short-subunit alcohol dehydrogenase family)